MHRGAAIGFITRDGLPLVWRMQCHLHGRVAHEHRIAGCQCRQVHRSSRLRQQIPSRPCDAGFTLFTLDCCDAALRNFAARHPTARSWHATTCVWRPAATRLLSCRNVLCILPVLDAGAVACCCRAALRSSATRCRSAKSWRCSGVCGCSGLTAMDLRVMGSRATKVNIAVRLASGHPS
jgi:hypothetical protein